MSSSKGSSKYKSTFGSLGGATSDSKSSKGKESERSSSKRIEEKSSRRTEEEEKKSSTSKSKSSRHDETESKSRSSHRDRDRDRDEEKSSRHRSRQKEDEYESTKKSSLSSSSKSKSHSRKNDDDEDKEHRRSSKHREDRDDDGSRKHREHKSEHRRHRDRDDDSDREAEQNGKYDDEPNYEDDFENDFEKDDDDDEEGEKVKVVVKDKKVSSSSRENNRKKYDSDDDDEDYKSRRRREEEKEERRRNRIKYDDYDDYADEDRRRGRVVKANAHVNVPTDLVEVYSSEIYFNHDSRDRQKRRAKDLFKSIIELDNKSFSLLDINPVQMRTVYSAHLKHEKVQTNDDTLEIEAQTDEIEMTTRWTQHPADDLKGYGIENQKFNYEASSDVLEQFRTDINFPSLQKFLQKSSKVIETLLREDPSLSERRVLTENKSDLEFSQGFSIFSIPKFLSKLTKTAILTNVVFAQDNLNHLVCSYDVQLGGDLTSSTLLLVWDVDEPTKPYRVLICETITTCLCYFSFIVVAGSMDGSIVLWDLRESPSLHSQNLKRINEANVIRSPTYTTAGVLLQENHMSEVRSILPLQNQGKENKDVFVQLATLEVDCKLIIWTVIELTNVDLTVFEKDLGLLPGGRIQLVKSFEINIIKLNNIIKTIFGRSEYQTWSLAVSTEKKNHFFISTNIGQIIHIERKGKSFSRTVMKSSYSDLSKHIKTSVEGPDLSSDGLLTVKTVSFHHEISDILLVSYGNGEIRLYDINFATPIKTWLFLLGTEIKEARWIESRSSTFMVLDEDDSKIFVWDLLTDDTQPVLIKKTKQFGCISFPSVKAKEGGGNIERIPFAYFDRNSQDLQVHLFSPDWTRKSDNKEAKKFAKLIKNYLLTF